MQSTDFESTRENHQYRLYYRFGHGVSLTPEIARTIIDTALSTPDQYTNEDKDFIIQTLSHNGLSELNKSQKTKLHSILLKSNVRVDFEGMLPVTFDKEFALPSEFNDFTGREAELKQLRRSFTQSQVCTVKIVGTGGIGKSRLASQFVHELLNSNHINWAVWLSGGLEPALAKNNIEAQLAALGKELGLDSQQLKGDAFYRVLYTELHHKGKGLIVFDDIPEYSVISNLMPECFGLRKMGRLFTTRDGKFFSTEIKEIPLGVFTKPDAKKYVSRILSNRVTEDEADLLAETLDCYPLALTQAIAYLINNPCGVKLYCERYQRSLTTRKLYFNAPLHGGDPFEQEWVKTERKQKASIAAVVDLSLEQVKVMCDTKKEYDDSFAVLLLASALAPEKAIPKALLGTCIPEDDEDQKTQNALLRLKSLSLLEYLQEAHSYQIHQVIQDVLKTTLSEDKLRELPVSSMAKCLLYIRSETIDQESEKILVIRSHLEALSVQLTGLPQTDYVITRTSILFSLIARAYCQESNHNKFLSYLEKEIKCYQLLRDEASELYVGCLSNLGYAKLLMGDAPSAIKHLTQALMLIRAQPQTSGENIGGCLLNLGSAKISMRLHQEALQDLNEALPYLIRCLGAEHVNVLKCYADVVYCMSESVDNIDLITEADNIIRKFTSILGNDHLELAHLYMNLGAILVKKKYVNRALEFHTKAMAIYKRTFGEHHQTIATCLINISQVQFELNQFPDSRASAEKAKMMMNDTNNADYGMCLKNLGILDLIEGNTTKAKELVTQAKAIFERVFGQDHHEVQTCREIIAEAEKPSAAMAIPKLPLRARRLDLIIRDFQQAATTGSLEELQDLMNKFGSCANISDKSLGVERTPLHWAVLSKRPQHVGLLLTTIGYTGDKDGTGNSALDYALMDKLPQIITHFKYAFMSHYKVRQDAELHTVVRQCANTEDASGLRLLIHLGVPVDHAEEQTGDTALQSAVQKGFELCARILIEAKASIFHVNNHGVSIFDAANNNPSLSKLLRDQAETALLAELKSEVYSGVNIIDVISEDMMPISSDLGLEVAQYLYSIGQTQYAITVLTNIIDSDPKNSAALILKSRCHTDRFEIEAAELCLNMALSLDNKIDIEMDSRKLTEAQKNYRLAKDRVNSVLEVNNLPQNHKVKYFIDLVRIGRLNEALLILNGISLQAIPKDYIGPFYYQKARCHFLNGNWSDAFICINQSLSVNRDKSVKPESRATTLLSNIIHAAHSFEKIGRMLSTFKILAQDTISHPYY